MAHFARLDENNVVVRVCVLNNTILHDGNLVEQEQLGVDFLHNLHGGVWVQTSYNGTFRKNFAGAGYTYDSQRDAFIPPKPFDSWVLNEDTCQWQAPTPMPEDGNIYLWDEETEQWVTVE